MKTWFEIGSKKNDRKKSNAVLPGVDEYTIFPTFFPTYKNYSRPY
jgi:hypothetical protein